MIRTKRLGASKKPKKVLQRHVFKALSEKVRKLYPFCQVAQVESSVYGPPQVACQGYLQGCHIVPRTYLGVAFLMDNIVSGCQAHHRYYTDRLLTWEEMWRAYDSRRWVRLWERARAYERNPFPKNDLPALLAAIEAA